MPTAEYTRFVHRVWDSLQQRTGRPVYYLDSSLIAGYCPACLDGTLRVRFLEHPRPGMTVGSNAGGPGRCSEGCSEEQIAEALFA